MPRCIFLTPSRMDPAPRFVTSQPDRPRTVGSDESAHCELAATCSHPSSLSVGCAYWKNWGAASAGYRCTEGGGVVKKVVTRGRKGDAVRVTHEEGELSVCVLHLNGVYPMCL